MRHGSAFHERYGRPGAGSTLFSARGIAKRFLAVGLTAMLAGQAMAASKPKKEKPVPTPAGSSLSGRIIGADGKPIRGAAVLVKSLDGEASWISKPSDKGGRFNLRGMHYGWAEVVVNTEGGAFLGDQAMNLPPGRNVVVTLSLLETGDKPASWWADRRVEIPKTEADSTIAGMALSNQKLTGVEYWKSPAGIAILISASVVALAAIAAGGNSYRAP